MMVLSRLFIGELEEPEIIRGSNAFRHTVEVLLALRQGICPVPNTRAG